MSETRIPAGSGSTRISEGQSISQVDGDIRVQALHLALQVSDGHRFAHRVINRVRRARRLQKCHQHLRHVVSMYQQHSFRSHIGQDDLSRAPGREKFKDLTSPRRRNRSRSRSHGSSDPKADELQAIRVPIGFSKPLNIHFRRTIQIFRRCPVGFRDNPLRRACAINAERTPKYHAPHAKAPAHLHQMETAIDVHACCLHRLALRGRRQNRGQMDNSVKRLAFKHTLQLVRIGKITYNFTLIGTRTCVRRHIQRHRPVA
jgi:hypothetical protein